MNRIENMISDEDFLNQISQNNVKQKVEKVIKAKEDDYKFVRDDEQSLSAKYGSEID